MEKPSEGLWLNASESDSTQKCDNMPDARLPTLRDRNTSYSGTVHARGVAKSFIDDLGLN